MNTNFVKIKSKAIIYLSHFNDIVSSNVLKMSNIYMFEANEVISGFNKHFKNPKILEKR